MAEAINSEDTYANDVMNSRTRRTMQYYVPPHNNPANAAQPKPSAHNTDTHAATTNTTAEPIAIDLSATVPEAPRTWTPKVNKVSPEEAQAALENQIHRFTRQPDGNYVREYDVFVAEFNRSTKLYIDAGMALADIKFEAIKTRSALPEKIAACKTLQDIADTKNRGVAAKVTLTEAQFQQLKGFYEAIVYPPRTPAMALIQSAAR